MTNTQFKTIRKNLNLTQVELAEQLDKSVKTIQSYEQGRTQIPPLTSKVMSLLNTNNSFKIRFLNDTITPLLSPLIPLPQIPVKTPGPDGSIHPGSFGVNRHLHVHTGVDLYTPLGSPVFAIEYGKIIKIAWFTGPSINLPWWNDTRAVYIQGNSGVFNYGEIQELPTLHVGQYVQASDLLGHIVPVLRKWKGRPMTMLHIELYDHGYTDSWKEWPINTIKPQHLIDPTRHLLSIESAQPISGDPYLQSATIFKSLNIG